MYSHSKPIMDNTYAPLFWVLSWRHQGRAGWRWPAPGSCSPPGGSPSDCAPARLAVHLRRGRRPRSQQELSSSAVPRQRGSGCQSRTPGCRCCENQGSPPWPGCPLVSSASSCCTGSLPDAVDVLEKVQAHFLSFLGKTSTEKKRFLSGIAR